MDIQSIFRDVKLGSIEISVLKYIQADPEKCIQQGIRGVAEKCHSNPSTLVRLAKKLKFSGWLEMVYFIKFNITLPKLDVTNDVDFMSIQPPEKVAPLLQGLVHERILIHGSGFSQLIAQYIYNKFLVTGVNASLALWPDYEILEQKNANKYDSIWLVSKSGRSSSVLSWVKALERKNINLVCFTGDHQSPLAQAADVSFLIHDPQKYDDDIYWSNPFFGYCILGFEHLLKLWFMQKQ
ncbi:RpiR family transcriptional regulator [Serratia fonticola]|jgi:DNA-binding MurR/RpiR family transcriptional regulator|uniref:RpiR family transcriptional regulator n=1 Tax=Serratia fonticola TaxID=47917 RepID=A0A559T0K3_SERFO|nr:MurR/RpiR family transcriptional regulator [Serratia fonticola]TQI79369.1 RpiR family transcriptional regulator [Serratia fonticola]TQI98606.1 RpiR family transcriptional regulator [Serratia fonticola]TVZ68134.1 RpiR family transcriptional regulator [Serratia fonticola]